MIEAILYGALAAVVVMVIYFVAYKYFVYSTKGD